MNKKLFLLLIPLLAALLIWALFRQRHAPPVVPFARVTRGLLVSTLITNGKVEPVEWVTVSAQTAGVVEKAYLEQDKPVARGAVLVELSDADARIELAAAQARLEQVRAESESILRQGGRAVELAEIDGELMRARHELEAARAERAALERLLRKQAAAAQELEEASRRVEGGELRIRTLEQRRSALAGEAERQAAEARLREAEAAVAAAGRRLERSRIRAPMDGVLYEAAAAVGSYLQAGDPVVRIGRTERVRVRVYVDEPELGRIAAGKPVVITWDAKPGRSWTGSVEHMPTHVAALGTRQVGELVCVIENPGRELLPGTNVNAEIRAAEVGGALSIPREALRREGGQPGVYLLEGNRIAWRKVSLGIATISRMQVIEGLAEGDAVALPSDAVLTAGAEVRPVFRLETSGSGT